MQLGIARGFFYYDYRGFIHRLLDGSEIEIVTDLSNDEKILEEGSRMVVDEACLPIKLFAGQLAALSRRCDRVLVPRIMKDFRGKWLCPKLLGIPELSMGQEQADKLLVTDPVYFQDEKGSRKAFWTVCRQMGMSRSLFDRNFSQAYQAQRSIALGRRRPDMEADWEFVPDPPLPGEILLPNTKRVFLAGHCYNVYDEFSNGKMMKKLDDLGIETITESAVRQPDRERAVAKLSLRKKPFWEAFIRILGSALCLQNQVDGIIYLSSFSCGPDAFIVEMMRTYMSRIPIMVLKLDEHRGEVGYETRLEAFADLLEKRRAS